MENTVIKKDDLVQSELFGATDEYVNMFVEWAIENLKEALNVGKRTISLNVSNDFISFVERKNRNSGYKFHYFRSYDEDALKEIMDKAAEILGQNGYSSCSYLITSDSSIVSYELKEWTRGWTMILSIDRETIEKLTKRIKRKLLWHNIRKWCFIVFVLCMFICSVMSLIVQSFQN